MISKFISLSIRITTLGSKFLLSLFMIKFLGIELSGEYGIFFSSITILTYLLGFDFYSFSTRDILSGNLDESGEKIKYQFLFYFILYIVFIPIVFIGGELNLFDKNYFLIFYLILVTEHLSIELYRLHVTFQQQIVANFNLFLRSGIWILFILLFWFFDYKEFMNLESIYYFWIFGNLLSLLFSLFFIYKLKLKVKHNLTIDWKWIRLGLMIAIPFFLTSLSFKFMQLADRFFVDYFLDSTKTGVYLFFGNIANVVETITQTTVVMYFSPKLITALSKNSREYGALNMDFKKKLVVNSLVTTVVVSFFSYFMLIYLDKKELFVDFHILLILLASKFLYNLSLTYHFYLYGLKKDRLLLVSTLIALFINLILNVVLIPILGLLGCAIASVIGIIALFCVKFYFSKKNGYEDFVFSSK